MKKLFYLLILPLCAVLVTGCDSDDEPIGSGLTGPLAVDKTVVLFNGVPTSSQIIKVHTEAENWNATTDQEDWIFFTTNDKKINILVSEYSGQYGDSRTGNINIRSGEYDLDIKVVQAAPDTYVVVLDTESYTFSNNDDKTVEVRVATNDESWTIKNQQDDWFTATKSSSEKLKLTVKKKDDFGPRNSSFEVVTLNGGSTKFLVNQTGKSVSLDVDKPSLTIPTEGGEASVKVTVTDGATYTAAPDKSWVRAVKTSDGYNFIVDKAAKFFDKTANVMIVCVEDPSANATVAISQAKERSLEYSDLLGDWVMSSVGPTGANPDYTVTFKVQEEGSSYITEGAPLFQIPIHYSSGAYLTIKNKQYVGMDGDLHIFMMTYDYENNKYSNSILNKAYSANVSYDDEADKLVWKPQDNGIWGSYLINAYYFRTSTDQEGTTTTNALSTYGFFGDCVYVK